MYAAWKRLLSPSIQSRPVELAGRGRRFGDQAYSDMTEAVEDISRLIEPQLGEDAFAFFGHSMGALLGYEVAVRLWRTRGLAPVHMFFSGRLPPDLPVKSALHNLDDEHLREKLLAWGGITESLYTNQDFMRMFLPIIRADLKIVETYSCSDAVYPSLPCSFSILVGQNDPLAPLEQMSSWSKFTTRACDFHAFAGGHFYLSAQNAAVVQLINARLCPVQVGQDEGEQERKSGTGLYA